MVVVNSEFFVVFMHGLLSRRIGSLGLRPAWSQQMQAVRDAEWSLHQADHARSVVTSGELLSGWLRLWRGRKISLMTVVTPFVPRHLRSCAEATVTVTLPISC